MIVWQAWTRSRRTTWPEGTVTSLPTLDVMMLIVLYRATFIFVSNKLNITSHWAPLGFHNKLNTFVTVQASFHLTTACWSPWIHKCFRKGLRVVRKRHHPYWLCKLAKWTAWEHSDVTAHCTHNVFFSQMAIHEEENCRQQRQVTELWLRWAYGSFSIRVQMCCTSTVIRATVWLCLSVLVHLFTIVILFICTHGSVVKRLTVCSICLCSAPTVKWLHCWLLAWHTHYSIFICEDIKGMAFFVAPV